MTDQILAPGRRAGKTHATVQRIVDAYLSAQLTVPLEVALADPALSVCLKNIVHANQANPDRMVDMQAEGAKLVVTPINAPAKVAPFRAIDGSRPDLMRRAAGDLDD